MKHLDRDGSLTVIDRHEPSAWLRGRIGELHTALTAGTFTSCVHLRPATMAGAALWKPGHLACAACLDVFRLDGANDLQCDRCAVVCEATINPHMIAVGHVLLLYGLCDNCHRREVPAP